MSHITIHDFKKAFESVILPEDEVIVLHGGIWSFGHLLDVSLNQVPNYLIDAIIDIVGKNRTLIMPAYTVSYPGSYPRTRKFDLIRSKPETGILVEVFWEREGTIRNISAINSYIANGPEAETIKDIVGKTLWGEGSVMEWFEKRNARICILGLSFQKGLALAHRVEEIAQVPYRYYKSFRGVWSDGLGNTKDWVETMFVRTLIADIDYEILTKKLIEKKLLFLSNDDNVPITSALSKDVIQVGLEILDNDPLMFVRNREEVIDWVKNRREAEINQLKPEEKPPFDVEEMGRVLQTKYRVRE